MANLGLRPWTVTFVLLLAVEAAAFPVSSTPVGLGDSAITVDGSGGATIYWAIDDVPDEPPALLGRRCDAAGDPVGPEFRVDTIPGQFFQTVDADRNASGQSVVVWTAKVAGLFRVYARRYDALGMPQGAETEVGAENSAPTLAAVAVDATGGFLVVWNSLGPLAGSEDDAVLARRYDAAGVAAGAAFTVNTTQARYPFADVTFTGAGYAVAWSGVAPTGTRVQRFDAGANPVGGEIAVAGETGRPSIDSDGSGQFVVAAADAGGTVQAWRFDANGDPIGGAIPVSAASIDLNARIAMDGGGTFVVVWQRLVSDVGDPQAFRVFGRRFDASGSPLTGELDLGAPDDASAMGPAIEVLPGDGFVATWTRESKGGSVVGLTWRPLTPVAGTSLRVKDPVDSTRRSIKLKLKDPLVTTIAGLGPDPVADGMTVRVFNTAATGDAACLALPASAWLAKATSKGPKHRYVDTLGANGPCRTAQAKRGEIKVTCGAKVQPIPYSLDEPSQGGIGIVVTSGGIAYCAEFGGIKTDVAGKFAAVKAPRPGACPVPPVSCP